MTRPLWAAICCMLVGASNAMAQGTPVFTEKTVHPFDPPVLGATRERPAPVAPASGPIVRGKTPRSHALELAEVFRRACLQNNGQTAAASDWALNHGFSPLPDEAVKAMADKEGAESGAQPSNVFVRQLDDADSVMLMLADRPLACSVVTRQAVDGPRLRERMAQLAAAWVGQTKAPPPVLSMDTAGGTVRTIGYKVASGQYHESLIVTAPTGVGSGLTLLALSIEDAPSR